MSSPKETKVDEFDAEALLGQLDAADTASQAAATPQKPQDAYHPAEPVEQPATQQQQAEPQAAQPSAPSAPAEEPVPEDTAFFRGRLHGPDAVYAHLIKTGIKPEAAFAQAYASQPQGGSNTAQEQPSQPDPATPSVADIERSLEEALNTRREAAEMGSVITPEFLELEDRVQSLRADLANAKQSEARQRQQAEAAADAAFDKTWAEADAKAVSLYGEHATSPDSELNKRVAAELDNIKRDQNHPLRGVANLPMILYPQFAAELGIAPLKVGAPAAKTAIPSMMPASGGNRTPAAVAPNAAQEAADWRSKVAEAAKRGDAQELEALI